VEKYFLFVGVLCNNTTIKGFQVELLQCIITYWVNFLRMKSWVQLTTTLRSQAIDSCFVLGLKKLNIKKFTFTNMASIRYCNTDLVIYCSIIYSYIDGHLFIFRQNLSILNQLNYQNEAYLYIGGEKILFAIPATYFKITVVVCMFILHWVFLVCCCFFLNSRFGDEPSSSVCS